MDRQELMLLIAGFTGSVISVLSKKTNSLRDSLLAIFA